MENDAMDVQGKVGGGRVVVALLVFCVCALSVWMGSMCSRNPICLSVEVPKIYRETNKKKSSIGGNQYLEYLWELGELPVYTYW